VGTVELPPAAVAMIRGMGLILMLLELLIGLEDITAIRARVPVLFLLVLQTELSVVGRPSSKAPAAFDLIAMRCAVV